MLYIELIKLWDEAVRAIDSRDWQGALTKLNQITEHNFRTMFVVASTHIALGQVDSAIKVKITNLVITCVKHGRNVGYLEQ